MALPRSPAKFGPRWSPERVQRLARRLTEEGLRSLSVGALGAPRSRGWRVAKPRVSRLTTASAPRVRGHAKATTRLREAVGRGPEKAWWPRGPAGWGGRSCTRCASSQVSHRGVPCDAVPEHTNPALLAAGRVTGGLARLLPRQAGSSSSEEHDAEGEHGSARGWAGRKKQGLHSAPSKLPRSSPSSSSETSSGVDTREGGAVGHVWVTRGVPSCHPSARSA
mmetsp:Transcript_1370/g.4228  ORF Transcript_1370/g.4228 Transcript_1370/m.4228 type:complete len:222 (-) Transcript_1370:223-888(-)